MDPPITECIPYTEISSKDLPSLGTNVKGKEVFNKIARVLSLRVLFVHGLTSNSFSRRGL
jgi:hypothetical protein